jgi:hypothetical protein
MDLKSIKDRLRHVYWLGGSPCSGKSTIATLIGQQSGVEVIHVDEAVSTRFGPYEADRQPCMFRWTTQLASGAGTWDDLWMRPVDALLAEVFECYAEQFDLLVSELISAPPRRAVLVEGNPLLPDRVVPLLSSSDHAMWLVADESFQRRVYPNRGAWVQQILSQCTDPDKALQNWMDRDVAFAASVVNQVRRQNGKLLAVDGSSGLKENLRVVMDNFGFDLAQKGAYHER